MNSISSRDNEDLMDAGEVSSLSSRRKIDRLEFPSVKFGMNGTPPKEDDENVEIRVTTAMAALSTKIKTLEKEMIIAGQAGDFRSAHFKDSKRGKLMRHQKSLSDLSSVGSGSGKHWNIPCDVASVESRESILQEVEDELGIRPTPSTTENNQTRPHSPTASATSESHPSRRSSSSHRHKRSSHKKKHKSATGEEGSKSIVVVVNDLLHSAPDTVKEDFAKGIIYRKTNDERLNTIYEREKKIESENPEEEECDKVHQKVILDPYGDPGRYTGMVVRRTGVPHGLGRFKYEHDGRTYEGDWRYGQWHGFGRSTCTNGDRYEGEYRQDQRHGFGTYKWADGREYQGDFNHDKRHGRGIFKWPNGTVYQGGFVMGKQEGRGKITYPDGTVEVGEWVGGTHVTNNEPSGSLSTTEAPSSLKASRSGVKDDARRSFSAHARKTFSFSEASTENSCTEWVCSLCTYVNNDPLHLSCAVCGHARESNSDPLPCALENETQMTYEEQQLRFMDERKHSKEDHDLKEIERDHLKEVIAMQNELMEAIQKNNQSSSSFSSYEHVPRQDQ